MNLKNKTFIALLLCILLFNSCNTSQKEEVTFKTGETTLSGTLYLPNGDGPFPAVVFVHGSGAETGENSSYSAKWFASIGYAALVYDKRGVGKSDGEDKDWRNFSFDTLANDVVSAVKFLSQNKKVKKTKIGLHASSQGGWVAPLAASKTNLINFLIIKSASVSTISEDRVFERSARLRREGFSDLEIKEATEMQLVEGKTVKGDTTPDDFTNLFEQNKNKPWFARVYPGKDPFTSSLIAHRTWYSTIMNFDPVVYLKQLEIPVMWIFGDSELDELGPIDKSISTLTELKKQTKPYEILQIQGEGHNIKEKKYERNIYEWLNKIHPTNSFKFKKHAIF